MISLLRVEPERLLPRRRCLLRGREGRAEESVRNRQVKLLVRTLSVPVRSDGLSAPPVYGQMTDRTGFSYDR
jgi:hypothetical protein